MASRIFLANGSSWGEKVISVFGVLVDAVEKIAAASGDFRNEAPLT
jgi:hypothetical protein